MFDVPIVGGVLLVLAVAWLLAMDGFMGRDGSPVSPEAKSASAVRYCTVVFETAPPVTVTSVVPARLVGYPDGSCRLRFDAGGAFQLSAGERAWRPDPSPVPLAGPANADVGPGASIRMR